MDTIKRSIVFERIGIIVHGVNCQGVMGSGVAMQLRTIYPDIYYDYLKLFNKHKHNRKELLGQITITKITEELYIVNAFTQLYYGRDKNIIYVDYDAVKSCFEKVNELYLETALPVKFPKIGAGLGNGDWNKIQEIINSTLYDEVESHLFIYG